MTIRNARISDLEQLVLLFEAYRAFYRKEAAIEQSREFLLNRMQQKDSILFLAEAKNKTLAGFTQLYPSFSSTRLQKMWILNDLYVTPEFRSQGVSKLLIEKAKIHCKQTKACGILLETESSNRIGNRLYPSVGFGLQTNNFYFWTNHSNE